LITYFIPRWSSLPGLEIDTTDASRYSAANVTLRLANQPPDKFSIHFEQQQQSGEAKSRNSSAAEARSRRFKQPNTTTCRPVASDSGAATHSSTNHRIQRRFAATLQPWRSHQADATFSVANAANVFQSSRRQNERFDCVLDSTVCHSALSDDCDVVVVEPKHQRKLNTW
jgi:hypothetical protein